MSRLLEFEFRKLFKSASFYICGVLMIFLGVSSFAALVVIDGFMQSIFSGNATSSYNATEFVSMVLTICNFPLLVGIMTAISVCSEYSHKTFKNMWSRGFTRSDVYFAKCTVNAVAGLIYAVAILIVAAITGGIILGFGGEMTGTIMLIIAVQIFGCIAYAILFTAVAFVLKKTAIAVVVCVAAPSLINTGAQIIDYILQYKEINIQISRFILSGSMVRLYTGYKYVEAFDIAETFLIAAGYIVISLILGYFCSRTDEI